MGEYFGFDKYALKLLLSYLRNRLQRVRIEGKCSTYTEIKSGVPQGSVLGPLLFVMFINDLFSVTENVRMHAFADDVQVYLSRRPGLVEDLSYRVNEDFSKVYMWAENNKLRLNPEKSLVLPIAIFKLNLPKSQK